MSFNNPRLSAHKIVCQCLTGPIDLQEALDRELQNVCDSRDKALITEMVYGYLRFKGRIDFVLSLFLDNPDRLPHGLKILLGLAGYELFFLNRVPDYATVSGAVDLSKRLYGRTLSGLVNAVLRKASCVDIFSENTFKNDSPDEILFWSRFYSCPRWIVKMWKKAYKKDLCLKYLEQSLDKPPSGVRESRGNFGLIANPEHVALRLKNSVLIKGNYPDLDRYLMEGRIFRQSFAGQQAMYELGMKNWRGPVWDMCAGSGGKTFLMLDRDLDVYSSDPSLKRLKNLKELGRSYPGATRIFAASGESAPLKSAPATILIDAPCTGLGVLSRRPDIKWKRHPKDVGRLALIQTELLNGASSVLNEQGRIVYLTCTLSPDENERRINDFLYEHKDFILEKTFQTDTRQELKEFFYGVVLKKQEISGE